MSFKKIAVGCLISLFSFLAVIAALEFIGSKKYPDVFAGTSCKDCWLHVRDENIGWWNKPNGQHRAVKACKNLAPCYDVTYTYDEFGRRITGNEKESNQHLIVFGGVVFKRRRCWRRTLLWLSFTGKSF